MSRETQLLFAGGTICCAKNDKGKLQPDAARLLDYINKADFDVESIVYPFGKEGDPHHIIDSINFDIGEHYVKLRDAALESLKQGKTPVICGGTDTLIWYSTLLTKDLKRMGWLAPHSGEKLVFLSSMKSVQEDGAHVQAILHAGKVLADQNLSGGFALCTENEDASKLTVHDVLNHFDKISAVAINPFRSEVPVGYIEGRVFEPTKGAYKPPPEPELVNGRHSPVVQPHARIAPPLLLGSDGEMLLRYLKTVASANPPFDGVLIEGFPKQDRSPTNGVLNKSDRPGLIKIVKQLRAQGVRVVFCNPIRYAYDSHNDSGRMEPVIQQSGQWPPKAGSMSSWVGGLIEEGVEFVTTMPKEAYLDMTLHQPTHITAKPQRITGLQPRHPDRKLKTLALRYVPDVDIVKHAIHSLIPELDEKTGMLGFSALPHNVLPDALADTLKEYDCGKDKRKRFGVTFEYAGNRYKKGGEVEGIDVCPYEAGTHTAPYLEPCPDGFSMVSTLEGRNPLRARHSRDRQFAAASR